MSFLLLILLGIFASDVRIVYADTDFMYPEYNGSSKPAVTPPDLNEILYATSTISSQENLKCLFTIREGSLDGPLAKTLVVGMPLFLRWDCDMNENYAMTVINCSIIGTTSGESIQFVDENGCSSSSDYPELVYSPSLHTAYSIIELVSINDSSITFDCQIVYCDKTSDGCLGITPPMCNKRLWDINFEDNIHTIVTNNRIAETSDNSEIWIDESISGMEQETDPKSPIFVQTTESSKFSEFDEFEVEVLSEKIENQEKRLNDVTIFFAFIIVAISLEALFYLLKHLVKEYKLTEWVVKKPKNIIKTIDV